GKNSLNRLIRCVCGKKIGPDPRNFNQRVSLGRNDLLIRTFPHTMIAFDIISGEYLVSSDSLEYIDRQRSALSEKRITINRTWHYCRRAGFRQPTIYQSGLY
ncbi:hypothetical protein LPQ20_02015, partial [Klebsiella pneumoniae]|nr:hypothetical protein [Klebsiella pneumoniae]MCJ7343573.1 hypothetical protein [Klebsiella pneumoniae]MDZ5674788.1 hypothetical protein [Klebsiella pneumoniae]